MPGCKYQFKSDRLGFRNWEPDDLAPFAQLNANRQVMEFFPSPLTRKESDELAFRIKKHIDDFGYGFFVVDELINGQFIGFIGFKNVSFEASFSPTIEIGWRLVKQKWDEGFATEGATECLNQAKSRFGITKIHSFTALTNKRSERVMQKIGMQKTGEFDHPKIEENHPLKKHVLYEISLA